MAWYTQVEYEADGQVTLPTGYRVYSGDIVRAAVVHGEQQTHDYVAGQDFDIQEPDTLLISGLPIVPGDTLLVWNFSRFFSTSNDQNGAVYAQRSDIERHYGKTNIVKWADLDNEGDVDLISERIQWALLSSTAYINDILRNGPYEIPFEEPYPSNIVQICAWYAGVLLYESRGVTDMDANGVVMHQLHFQKKEVQKRLRSILSGRTDLGLATTSVSFPQVVSDDE